ncbi:MAG TPA: CVNH domain-containing protein [Candidatus Angelobacter sp.]|nr:CVNH domain-containing protein [Candidatus Angelobacter sp.]
MHYLTTLGAVALAMALFQPVAQNNWQNGVPGGSYAQTCRDIRTNGNSLEATCDTGSGNWTRTSLQDFNQCTAGSIQNIYGQLQCTRTDYGQNNGQYNGNNGQDNGQGYRRDGGPNYQNGVPDGGYTQNCRNIRTSGSTLLATCQQRNGRWRQASLRNFNQCEQIDNNNGRLVCSR